MKKSQEQFMQDGRTLKSKLSPRATGSGPVWELRQELGITRKQMAERLHCSIDTIRRAEKSGREISSAAVKANLAVKKRRFNYQPSTVYEEAVAVLQGLLDAEDADRVRRACAEVTSEVNKKQFAEINGLKEARHPSITRLMAKPVRDTVSKYCIDALPFIDHPSLWLKEGKPAVFLSEVYGIGEGKMQSLRSFCEENDLDWSIRAMPSTHFPGATVTITIYKKGLDLRWNS